MKFSRHPTNRPHLSATVFQVHLLPLQIWNRQWSVVVVRPDSSRVLQETTSNNGLPLPLPLLFLTSRNEGSGEVVSQTSAITFRLSAARCNSHETQLPLCAMRKPNSAINSVEAGRERRIERGQGSFRAFSRFFSRRTQQARHELKGGLRPSRRPLSPRVFCSIFFSPPNSNFAAPSPSSLSPLYGVKNESSLRRPATTEKKEEGKKGREMCPIREVHTRTSFGRGEPEREQRAPRSHVARATLPPNAKPQSFSADSPQCIAIAKMLFTLSDRATAVPPAAPLTRPPSSHPHSA